MTAIPTSNDILIWRILDHARNFMGPLGADVRARLERVINDPSQETWDNAYTIIVGVQSARTLWQAVSEVAGAFPASKPSDAPWPLIPSKELLLIALRNAVLGEVAMPTSLKDWPSTGDVHLNYPECRRWYLPGGYFIDINPPYIRARGKYSVFLAGGSPKGFAQEIDSTNNKAFALEIARDHLDATRRAEELKAAL